MAKKSVPIVILILRILMFILLLISLVVLATIKFTIPADLSDTNQDTDVRFKDFYAYRYLLSVEVIGCAYMLLQIPFAAISVASGNKIGGSKLVSQFLIVTDIIVSLLFASGVGAGFGYTVDEKHYVDAVAVKDVGNDPEYSKLHKDMDKFFDMAHISTGFLLMATVCMTVVTIVSAYSKK
uniref:CASP-like protein n=1 Tax=Ananas comosus var. bracteatus TaxID=296719 RepID=A0A6V7NVN4_ANACO|nr:unnamed protein product [Ananas comosus var. bracteatus]